MPFGMMYQVVKNFTTFWQIWVGCSHVAPCVAPKIASRKQRYMLFQITKLIPNRFSMGSDDCNTATLNGVFFMPFERKSRSECQRSRVR